MSLDATVAKLFAEIHIAIAAAAVRIQQAETERVAIYQEVAAALEPLAHKLAVLSGSVAEPEPVPEPPAETEPKPEPEAQLVLESEPVAETLTAAAA